ncbi:MAG: amidase [Sulfitobacter sp.]
MPDILEQTALDQSAALERGDLSAVELMQATLERIAATNGTVNAIVGLRDTETLLAEAQAADNGPRTGWLHGIPMAIKDLANVKGMVTSKGSSLFKDDVAQQDDLMVSRLRAAGALFIGKTNTPEFGLGSHTFNPVHGATCNPYVAGKSAGGSSGGAAAALAMRMVAVADGSDMMGSLRNPAGWNNVYGMRPSWGTVPGEPEGEMFLQHLATSGPMARSPRDLAALLDTMTGSDPRVPLSLDTEKCLPQMADRLARQRIGWLGDWDGALPFEDGILSLSQVALSQMQDMGHSVAPLHAPFDSDLIWDSWISLRSFAVGAGLLNDFEDPTRRAFLKPAAIWEVERGIAMSGMDVHKASLIRSDWFRAAAAVFETVDVLVLPSAQVWPFDVTMEHPTEIAGISMDTYHRWMQVVVPASLLGLPVVNVPIGFGETGLPAGLQLIGPRGSDARLLQLAEEWHIATDWPASSPPALA